MAITRAPRTLANASANSDTPPDPCTTTVCPGRSPAPSPVSAFQAVTAAQGERRRLGEGEVAGNRDEGVLVEQGELGEHAVREPGPRARGSPARRCR
ncbi:hypothetical protein [Actinophytocola xanthii]|uniref:hypothetical protein n=1 Tax=Actinophytocola xanthii TaxID=1912961 RepID=UPI0018E9BD01|nr:hypothetical protein [Actinophytocola xanthii]